MIDKNSCDVFLSHSAYMEFFINRSIFQISALGLAILSLTACGGSKSTSTPSTPVVQPATNTGNTNTGNTNTGNTNTGNTTNINTDELLNDLVAITPQNIAKDLKEDYNATQVSNIVLKVDGKTQATINLLDVPNGFSNREVSSSANFVANGKSSSTINTGAIRSYKQANSAVVGIVSKGRRVSGGVNESEPATNTLEAFSVMGNVTKTLPASGTVNYVGKSFDNDSEGSFNYNINFGTKIGQGQVSIDGKNATLHATRITNQYLIDTSKKTPELVQGHGISEGRVSGGIIGEYNLGIFGKNATEVAGHIEATDENKTDIGFAGTKK